MAEMKSECKCYVQVIESDPSSGNPMTPGPSEEIPWDIDAEHKSPVQPGHDSLWVTTEFDPNDRGWTRPTNPNSHCGKRFLPRQDGMLCCSIPKPPNASGDVRYWWVLPAIAAAYAFVCGRDSIL